MKKIYQYITKIIKKLVLPKNPNQDLARQELVLNIILLFSIGCFSILNSIRIYDIISNPSDRGLSIIFTLVILFFFIFLLFLSKKGYLRISSYLLIFIYSLPMVYSFILWGADLPAGLLMFVLVITLFGVLMAQKVQLLARL